MYEKRPVNILLSFIYVFKKNIVLNFKKNAKQLIVIINHDYTLQIVRKQKLFAFFSE